jgi:hypothetical protein
LRGNYESNAKSPPGARNKNPNSGRRVTGIFRDEKQAMRLTKSFRYKKEAKNSSIKITEARETSSKQQR